MIKQIKSKKTSRFYARFLSLLVILSLLVTSGTMAIAVKSYRASHTLSQQTFTLTPEEGVTVTLNGLMPDNGYAEAKPAEADGEGVLHAYDITIHYAGGGEFEPAEDAPINVSFESAAIAEANANEDTSLAVEHITDDGEVEDIYLAFAKDDTAKFVAESFSVYIIREQEGGELKTPRKVFWFLDSKWTEYRDAPSEDSGVPSEAVPGAQYLSGLYLFPNTEGEMVSTQIVKDGEKLHPIVMPENYDWGSFIGWYQVELDLDASKLETQKETGANIDSITRDNLTQYVYTWPDDPVQFNMDNEISVKETEDTYVYLAPLFSRYRFVNFRDHERVGDGPSNIVARKLLVFGDDNQATVDISDVTADSPDAQSKVFFGWKFKNKEYQTRTASGETMASTITIAKDDLGENHYIDIYAVFKDAAWIYFVHGEKDWGAQYVGAMFAYLYDPANDPNDRVGIDQLPSTTRPGYVFDGWYTGHMDGEHIVYEQQVSMPLISSSVTGDSAVITTDGQTINIDDKGTYIRMGKLYLQNTLTLYAKWRPENTADYKVVIWRQKVSDDKNATDDQKTYDYYDYVLMEDQPTGSVILDTQDYKNKHFEDLANTTDPNHPLLGCHYSRTEVVVNGHTYDGDIPAERVKGVVASDGSAVVNVYYDRDLMVMNFYYTNDYKSYAPASAVSDANRYSLATSSSNANNLYGVVNDKYYRLTKTTISNYYVYRYEYFKANDNEDNRFGIVGDEYVPLNAVPTYKWMKTGGYYVKEQGTPSTTKNYKGIVNGKFVALYYRTDDDGSYWTYGNNQRYNGEFYYEAMTGGETSEHTGPRYVLNGDGVEATDSVTPEVQYAQDEQGDLYELQRESTGTVYYYNNTEYTGDRYERTEYERVQYKGIRYRKNTDGSFSEADNNYTGTLYGRENENSPYKEIIKKTGPLTTYTYIDNGETKTYEGTVFAATNKNYKKRVTWTGLFGQTIGQNGYDWSTVSIVEWKDTEHSITGNNGTVQTLLDAFELAYYPYNLDSIGKSGSYRILHYKQRLNDDGTTVDGYDETQPYVAYSSGGTFIFSNKFLGFKVASWSNRFNTNGSNNRVEPDEYITNPSNPLYVYHERKLYKVTLVDLRTDNNSPGLPKDQDVENIPYEAHINKFIDDEGYRTPPARENYTFSGWYFDKAFTKPADIDQITMGDGNLVLYAKWDLKYYFVEIDPNGGEMEDQTEFSQYTGITSPRKQSTYTWLRYGTKLSEYANVERSFVPDDTHGTYVYVNVKFAKTFDEAKDKNWDLRLPSQYRAAFYCLESELQKVYNEHFTYNGQPLITWDDFNDYCIDKGHKYRKAASYEGYTLVAWYKVNDDGTTSNEMYNFNDPVTKPTRIRAVWRRTGEYYIEYNPYMRQYHIGDVVTKNGQTYTNPVRYDPENPEEPTQVIDKYLDQSQVFILAAPSHIPEYYTFRGWQLLNPDGTIADVEPFYPTREFTIESKYADSNGRIRFEACYEPEPESARRVETAALILDANSGVAQRNGLPVYDEEKIYVDLQKDQVIFQKQPNNFEVTLADYYNNFLREDGYILIGWNKTPDKEGLDPDFAADAVIGVDNKDVDDEHPNILYAVWEPEYYLTLENHSTEYSVIFNLEFTGNGENNEGLVYCNAEEGEANYDRHLLSDCKHPNMQVKKVSPNRFTIIMTPAADSENPNSKKLVIPEGANATYTVTGRILAPTTTTLENSTCSINDTGVINSNGQALNRSGKSFSVYNSGGAGERLTAYEYSNWYGVYRYKNLAGTERVTDYSVQGQIKLGREGQKVAFYTGATENVKVSIAARFYDPATNQWMLETDEVKGPNATLTFNKGSLVGDVTTNPPGVENLDIIEGAGKTFGISETYSNTAYKFIGWYAKEEATPSDIPIDGEGTPPNETITGLTVPNHDKTYYALYVPLADGNLNIYHNEKATSAGYPKRMLVQAQYTDADNVQQTVDNMFTTKILSVVSRNPERVSTKVEIPVKESDSDKYVTITLGSMSGYGSVYGNTYEGPDMLSCNVDENTDAHRFDEGDVVALLFYDPAQAKMDENYSSDLPIGNGETKHLYKHIVKKKVADLFEDSETVKGYKVLNDLVYESDFARKYEFIYSYIFRDGTTQRKYCESGNTAVFASEESLKDFVAESAPYITNFGEELKWDYSSITFDKLYDKGKIYAYMNSIQNKKQATVLVKTEGSGVTTRRQVAIGETFKEGELPTAELIMGNEQFHRWAITNTYTEQVIGYCYYYQFTFMVWQDITITAEYVPLKEDGEYHRYMPDDETEAYISIQHLDTTRNRWVALDEDGNIIRGAKDDPETYYDNLIDDYSILYVDHGKRINTNPDKYQVGLIYEIVGQITDENNPDVYSVEPNDSARQNAINWLLARPEKTTGSLTYNGAKKFYYSQFDPAELTHDNRIEFYRGIDNLKNAGELNPNAKYVFNVYAYMKIKNENAEGNGYSDEGVVVQSSPVTLQLYRLAVKTTAKSN